MPTTDEGVRVLGPAEAARAVIEAREGGAAVAVLTRCDGAADGRRLLVYADGTARGSLGDSALDAAATRLGIDRLRQGSAASGTVELASDAAGDAVVYVEVHRAPGRLWIVGAGHIAVPLARVGHLLGFPIVVLDDREGFATDDRFPAAAAVRRVDFGNPFRDGRPGPDDYVVLVTRAHRYDYDCLLRLVDGDALPGYIGMVGSRRRVRAAFRALLDAGIPAERLAAVHAPIGVGIGAETPEEIAVSIAAEIVAVRRGVTAAGSLRDRERVVARFLADDDDEGPPVEGSGR
jgi:xanthine dehydrogenase accessory factor